MKQYTDVVQDSRGNVVAGATVTVTDHISGSSATVYGTNAVGSNVNPLTTDSKGRFTFYAPNGRYDITVSKTGMTTSTQSDILIEDEFVSVTEYGAKGDGTTDDTVAVQAAINSNQPVFFPKGVYLISSVTISSSSSQRIFGSGQGDQDTYIKAKDATSNVFVVAAGSVEIDHLQFITAVTRTAGSFISVTSSVCHFHHLRMTGPFIGITNSGTSNWFDDIYIASVANSGVGIKVTGGTNLHLTNVNCINGSGTPTAGVEVTSTADITLCQTNVLGFTNGLLIDPGAGQTASSVCASECFFDSCTNALNIVPSSTGSVLRSRFTGCWFNGSTYGARINNSGSGTLAGVQFTGCQFFGSSTEGLSAGGTGTVADLSIVGCEFATYTSDGIGIGATVTDFTIVGNSIGTTQNGSAGLYGIFITAGANNFIVTGNRVRGNTTANIQDNSGGVNKVVANNLTA